MDEACKRHDIQYSKHKDIENRHEADKQLQTDAWQRAIAKNSTLGERLAAMSVTAAMKMKRTLGMGVKQVPMGKAVVSRARRAITQKKFKQKNLLNNANILKEGASVALVAAKKGVKEHGGRKRIRKPRVIALPKRGGILPLIPIFAGLSALGSLAGGAAGIAKAVQSANSTKKALSEANRHNKSMEAIAIRNGKGLYLKQYKKGMGLYLKKPPQ